MRTLSLKTRHSLSTCQPLSTNFPTLWLTLSRGFPTPYPSDNPRVPGDVSSRLGLTFDPQLLPVIAYHADLHWPISLEYLIVSDLLIDLNTCLLCQEPGVQTAGYIGTNHRNDNAQSGGEVQVVPERHCEQQRGHTQ